MDNEHAANREHYLANRCLLEDAYGFVNEQTALTKRLLTVTTDVSNPMMIMLQDLLRRAYPDATLRFVFYCCLWRCTRC